jgi:hypothetical protein
MKKYIKDNKIYNSPITIKSKKEVDKKVVDVLITTNDEKTILAAGYEVYVPPKPPIEVLIEKSNRLINKNTDDKILNDFVWKDNEFYLTMENQQNFANLFIAKDYITYPQTIKTKNGYFVLNNKEEVTEFYLAGVAFIKECLEAGWQEKINAEEKIRNVDML